MFNLSVSNQDIHYVFGDVLNDLVKYISDGVVAFDTQGVVYGWNTSFESISGLSSKELDGVNINEVCNFASGLENLLSDLFKGKRIELPVNSFYFIKKKGIYKSVMIPLITEQAIKGGLLIVCELRDADYLELMLFEKDALISDVEKLAGIGSWDADLKTNYSYWSEEMYEIFELDPAKHIYNREFRDYLHPDDVVKVDNVLREVKTDKQTLSFGFRIITGSNKLKYISGKIKPVVSAEGEVVRLLGFCQDITEKKKMENLLSRIVHSSMDGICVFKALHTASNDISDFEIVFVNSVAENFLGRSLKMLKGKRLCTEYPGMKASGLFDLFRNVVQTGEVVKKEHLYENGRLSNWLRLVVMKHEDCCIVTFQDFTDTMRTLEEMEKNQAFLYLSQEAGVVGSFEWDIFTGKLVRFTPQFARIIGLEEGREHKFVDFYNKVEDEDKDTVWKCMERVLSGEFQAEVEFRISQDNGQYKYCWVKAVSLNNEDSALRLVGSVVDITQRKLSEKDLERTHRELEKTSAALKELNEDLENRIKKRTEELSLSNERFRLISMATNDAMWDWNFANDFIWYNEAFMENFGFEELDFSKGYEFWKTHLHPEDRERVVSGIQAAIDSGNESWRDEYRFLKADGTYTFIMDRGFIIHDAESRPVRMVGAMIEASDISVIERRLKESEENYRFLAESMPQLIWITDGEGKGLYVNHKWVEYTGVTFEDYKSSCWTNSAYPDDLSKAMETWHSSLRTGGDYSYELRLKRSNGDSRWFLARAVPMKDATGKIRKWIGTFTDIHDQKLLMDNLSETKRTLDEFNKELNIRNEQLRKINRELDNFVYAASHDLRSPVRNIESLITLISEALPKEIKTGNVSYFLDLLNRSTNNLKSTIQDLTEVTKVEEGEMEEANVVEILEDVKLSIKDLLDSSQVRIVCNFEIENILFSRKNLRSILFNLLSNSIKYRSPRRSPEVHIETHPAEDGYVLLTVSDNGMGIRKEDMEKVFAPFKRIHYDVEGSGIGMSIVKRIIDNNGGRIELESEVDKGTTIKVFIKK